MAEATPTDTELKKPDLTEEEIAKKRADLELVQKGEKSWAEVLGVSGSEVYAIADVGYKLLQEGNYDQAQTVFEGLITLNKKDPNLHMWLGSTLHRKGEVDEAIACYTTALELDPKNATCLANRGELYIVQGKADIGTKDLMKAIEVDPEGKQPSTVRARAILATVAQKLQEKKAAK